MNDVDSNDRVRRPWRRDRPWLQLAALLLLTILLCARYPSGVLSTSPRPDELAYVTASERVAAGQGPYYGPYFYPPALAIAGAGVIRLAGVDALLLLIRTCNVLGIALLVWWSVALLGMSYRRRLIVAALYLAIGPPVAYGIVWGNLSLGIATAIFLGLLLWPVRPALAGILLGASIAAKPVAPVAALVLLLQRAPSSSGGPQGRWAHRIAGGIALALAGGFLLVPPYLAEFLSLTTRMPPFTRNVSLYWLLSLFGIKVPMLVLFGIVAALAVLWTRRRARSPWELLLIAIPTALLAVPLVWSHTLILTLPIQVVALDRAWRSLRASTLADRPLRRLETTLVLGAVLAIQLSEGVGGIDDRAFWIQGLVILLPALAPLALSLYLLRPAAASASNRSQRGITRGRS